jgi:hypothetical protein
LASRRLRSRSSDRFGQNHERLGSERRARASDGGVCRRQRPDEDSNAVAFGTDTQQQSFLTTPQQA